MRNKPPNKINQIMALVKNLPYFGYPQLSSIENNRHYLRVLLSRYQKAGKIIRLKKGLYVTQAYLDGLEKQGNRGAYEEFICGILHPPAYLSLDYVLYQHHLLTEMPANYTAVSLNKTFSLNTPLGRFFYHKVKKNLFRGYEIKESNGFVIYRAVKAKALFDYLYLRKNLLTSQTAFRELRLNLVHLNQTDLRLLQKYVFWEKSKKMKTLYNLLLNEYDRR